jgi:hypothetical protein
MWTVTTLQLGYPGKTTHHGGLGWSTIGLARDGQRVVVLLVAEPLHCLIKQHP